MKYLISYAIVFLYSITLLAQISTIETNFGRLFSGFGDQHGEYGSAKLKVEVSKGFYIATSYGIGHSAQLNFDEEYLKTLPNLLVADEYLDNYPFPATSSTFDIGQKNIRPSTDFNIYSFASLGAGKNFHLTPFLLNIEAGIAWQKMQSTYITFRETGEYNGLFTDGLMTVNLAVPLLVSFIDYPWYVSLGTKYKINDHLYLGLFADVYSGKATVNSCYGLSLQVVIAEK